MTVKGIIVMTGFLLLFLNGVELGFSQTEKDIRAKLTVPDSNQVQILITQDGSKLIGHIVEAGEEEIEFKTEHGTVRVLIANIEDIETVAKSMHESRFSFPNPNHTRLFLSPTGRMLKQGKGFFADVLLFFPGFAYGVTDNFTIGGGLSLFPGVDIDNQLLYFTPKIGLKATEGLELAAGALIMRIPNFSDDGDSPFVGVLHFVGTVGERDRSVTVGLGYGFEDIDLADKPVVIVGGELRVSNGIALVTENFVLPGVDAPIISYGVRFLGEKISVDGAFFNILNDDAIFPGLPYIDFVINF